MFFSRVLSLACFDAASYDSVSLFVLFWIHMQSASRSRIRSVLFDGGTIHPRALMRGGHLAIMCFVGVPDSAQWLVMVWLSCFRLCLLL